MAFGITPNETNEYVLVEDQDKRHDDPTRTVFLYRTLTPNERARLENSANSMDAHTGSVTLNVGTNNLLAIRASLLGWRNYRQAPTDEHPDGEEIPFETSGPASPLGKSVRPPTDETLARMHPKHLHEVANAIRENQRLSPDDVKN